MRTLLRHVLLPLMVLAAIVVVWAASRANELLVIGVVAVAAVTSFVCERVAPFDAGWNLDRDDRWRDVAHTAVNEGTIVASMAFLGAIGEPLSPLRWWPAGLPFAVQAILAVVIADAGITLVHWWSHRSSGLWRFHAVHHSVTRMYGLNGLMKHPLHQTAETAAGVGPLLVVGIPADVLVAVAAIVVLQLLVQHSNVAYPTRGIAAVWVTNRAHRMHHLNRLPDGDVNFGLFLTVWDRLLGTFRPIPALDVRDGELGLAGRTDYPTHYLDQLIEPFRTSSGSMT